MQIQVVKKLFYNTHFAFISAIHRLFSTSRPLSQSPPSNFSTFAVEYLVKSCGLPMDKAMIASKKVPQLKSPEKPDSVLQFLRQNDLTDADIRKIVNTEPRILCATLENTIQPRLMDLREIGFSQSQVFRLFPLSPRLFICKTSSLQRTIEFWKSISGSLEGVLTLLKKNPFLLTTDVEKVAQPNILFLKEHCGVSSSQIGKMLIRHPHLFSINPSKWKDAAKRAEKLGIPRGSGSFIYALQIALSCSPEIVDAKIENLKKLGFSKTEIDLMIKKQPMLLKNSNERICNNIDFLTSEVGLNLPYIANNPLIILFSLERRLMPRHYVMKSLKSNGLGQILNFCSAMIMSDDKFADKFIRPHKDLIPDIFEAYECTKKIGPHLVKQLADTASHN